MEVKEGRASRAPPSLLKKNGGYRITAITPVCGTGYLGSIPSSRPF